MPVDQTILAAATQARSEATEVTARRYRWARAYRGGVAVCGRVELWILPDTRIGLAPRERRQIFARFAERLAPDLREEIKQLARRRGAMAKRIADRLDPIEFVFDDPRRGRRRLIGRLEPPSERRWELSENQFVVRECL